MARQQGDQASKLEYTRKRNECKQKLKKDRSEHEKAFSKEIEKDRSTKDLWNTIKKKAGWVTNLAPGFIQNGAVLVKDRVQSANIINNYYKNKIENLISSIPPTLTDPTTILSNKMREWIGEPVNPNKLSLQTTSLKEIEKIIG